MWSPLWHRGILSLVLMLTTACALLTIPDDHNTGLRSGLMDAVAPGARCTLWLKSWGQEQRVHANRAIASISRHESVQSDEQADQLTRERDAAVEMQRQLTAQVALLRRELDDLREMEGRFLSRQETAPLVRTLVVAGRVIGNIESGSSTLNDRLIDAGASVGIAEGDLIVDSPIHSASPGDGDLLIDQGYHDSITADAPVITGGSLVGRVRHCGEWTSTVQRLTDPDFRVGARLVRQVGDGPVFGAAGIFAGRGDSQGDLTLVPSTEPVVVGDLVYTQESVAGRKLMLFIGTVSEAEVVDGEPHWRIRVAPQVLESGSRVDVLAIELNPQRLTSIRSGHEKSEGTP